VVAGRTKRHISIEEEVAKRLLSLRNPHASIREWVRASALQGIITDGNGSTVYNLNTVFGIVPTVIDFVLGTPATDVIGKCQQVWQSISSNLHGELMRGVERIDSATLDISRLITFISGQMLPEQPLLVADYAFDSNPPTGYGIVHSVEDGLLKWDRVS
jgi:hypothetical protein